MPGKQVAADFVAHAAGAFDVDPAAAGQGAEVGAVQGLTNRFKAGPPVALAGHGEANAVDGHRGAQLQPLRQAAEVDLQES